MTTPRFSSLRRMCGYLRRRDPGYARLFEDSINLLPYRGLRAARRRSRYFIQLLLAACLGLVAALSMGYWQQIHVARGDAHTAQLQQSLQQLQAAQAEHAQLEQVIAAYAHRAALVASLAVARDNLFHLLAALGRDPAAGLSLDEIRYRDGRATLTGVVPDQRVLTAWVGQLEQAVGLATVEIVELQNAARRDSPRRNRDRVDGAAPAAFSVRVAVGDEDSPDAAQAVSARGSLSSGRGGLHLAAGGVMSAAQPYRQIEPSSAQLAAPGAVP